MTTSRDLFMKKKTENEVYAAISYLVTGLEEIKKMVSDCYEIPIENIIVNISHKDRNEIDSIQHRIHFTDCVGFNNFLSCEIKDLPKILKEKSEKNYSMLTVKEEKFDEYSKDLDEIRSRQFLGAAGIKLIKKEK